MTCGDLGLSATEVEKQLQAKFHLAELWDCVLLLDEADVFLAERNRQDLMRNSLVSVFLRVMEYFSGIMLLTTNRVGSFDPAFTSRIHLHLYYPPLGREQSRSIWQVNIKRLKESKKRRNEHIRIDADEILDYAIHHFDLAMKKKRQVWNGRQIKNSFQTASALAEYEAYEAQQYLDPTGLEDRPVQTHLRVEHFKVVARASMEFDDYLQKTHGVSPSLMARNQSLRSDDWDSHNTTPIYRQRQRAPLSASASSLSASRLTQVQTDFEPPKQYPRRPPQPYNDGRGQQYLDANVWDEGGMEGEDDHGPYEDSYDKRGPRMLWPTAEEINHVDTPDSGGKFPIRPSPAPRQKSQPKPRAVHYAYGDEDEY